MKDLYWNNIYLTEEEYKIKLEKKLELIKNNPEYYWKWEPSKNKDYIYYKKMLQEKLKK